jgi:hypothetical protein
MGWMDAHGSADVPWRTQLDAASPVRRAASTTPLETGGAVPASAIAATVPRGGSLNTRGTPTVDWLFGTEGKGYPRGPGTVDEQWESVVRDKGR